MAVVVPVEADVNEAQQIAKQSRDETVQPCLIRGPRGLELERHDLVIEGLEPVLLHADSLASGPI
ncbi:hypothetical protein AOC05_14395 [Arthrobacter alpinus]|uniref:Uncharacterized protein n=1 Tax=Arthrobacter alpinus TaxID=656366 RepID=A0A0M3UGS4_9MICC|nr:hypothetical protein AOC05_14395 [Arthrobacter alpinus]